MESNIKIKHAVLAEPFSIIFFVLYKHNLKQIQDME